jgi:hypothetical protein
MEPVFSIAPPASRIPVKNISGQYHSKHTPCHDLKALAVNKNGYLGLVFKGRQRGDISK